MTPVDITIAICTWNRSQSLRLTLDFLTQMSIPDGCHWELLVINNACTDDTPQVIESFLGRLPIREIHEAKPGLSNARNCAVAHAAGNYMIWTDDDVSVSTTWLTAYHAAFSAHPDADVFGGPVIPHFEGNAPSWVTDNLALIGNVYAERRFGDQPFPLEAHSNRLPFGANFAIRTATQRQCSFDPALGFVQGKLVAGEESEVINGILDRGGSGWWVPAASVQHRIEPFRQTAGYVRRYFTGQGEQQAPEQLAKRTHSCPKWVYRRWLENTAQSWLLRLTGKNRKWLGYFITAAYYRGMLNWCRNTPLSKS